MTLHPGAAPVDADTAVAAGGYPVQADRVPDERIASGRYVVSFARSAAELDEVLRLRYRVFNLELGEGLEASHVTGRDEDGLDARFHHLLIRESDSGACVGTYRMQTAEMAGLLGGFYTSCIFALSGLPAEVLSRSVEIGRACVDRSHRNGRVLHLLWRGLAAYLSWNRKRYLFGCCSLTTQDQALGLATHKELAARGHLHETFRVAPLPHAVCGGPKGATLPPPHIPALFQSYLNLGAKACGPPAIDREFQTIDFLVLLDVDRLGPRVLRSFFR